MTVDLATGNATNLGFITGIENVIGGGAADTITGDDQDNILDGGPGDDTFAGGGGDDTVRLQAELRDTITVRRPGHGGGTATLDFSAVTTALSVSVAADDSMTSTAGRHTSRPPARRRLVGGPGINTLGYSAYGKGIVADLADGDGDRLRVDRRLQNVTGSNFADSILGDPLANVLQGGGGDDTIGGDGGNDMLDGGPGTNCAVRDAGRELHADEHGPDRTGGSSGAKSRRSRTSQHASLTGGRCAAKSTPRPSPWAVWRSTAARRCRSPCSTAGVGIGRPGTT